MRRKGGRAGVLVVLAVASSTGCMPEGPSDDELRSRVEAALAEASDLQDLEIQIEARDGVVTLTGSLGCEDCVGLRTPGGSGTVQQTLGAVVRAVPGVERVEFSLDAEP